jgi:hypothetical protein
LRSSIERLQLSHGNSFHDINIYRRNGNPASKSGFQIAKRENRLQPGKNARTEW